MNTNSIQKQFLQMGVRLKVEPPRLRKRWERRSDTYSVDVREDNEGEYYVLLVPDHQSGEVDAQVLQARPKEQHLLLMLREDRDSRIDRFLCGHDEREWFVAAVPDRVSTVADALESLKPYAVRIAQARLGLKRKLHQKRKNKAFIRQGEWFFLPTEVQVEAMTVLRWEPVARSGGKPHMVEFLVRTGGQLVYFCQRHPRMLTETAYHRFLARNPKAKSWKWDVRRVSPRVYAKGQIRHPDHKTVTLDQWHEVLMNTENQSETMRHVAFID
ncbi:MAG: hypothetical protein AAF357_15370 [Verrucomicrobiota bacterium]